MAGLEELVITSGDEHTTSDMDVLEAPAGSNSTEAEESRITIRSPLPADESRNEANIRSTRHHEVPPKVMVYM